MFDYSLIFEYLLVVSSVALTYLFGRLQASNSRKTDAIRERYTNFYVPYISRLYAGRLDLIPFSTLSFDGRSVFFDLVMKNLQYLGVDAQSHVAEFYTCYLNLLEYDEDPVAYQSAPAEADAVFRKLTLSVLKESKNLSARLRMPDITKAFSEVFVQTK